MHNIYKRTSPPADAIGGHKNSLMRSIMPSEGAQVLVDRRPLINFGSDDALGLAKNPLLQQRSVEYTQRFGTSSTSARLSAGNLECFDYVERKLASMKGAETALILHSSFQTSVTVFAALIAAEATVVSDRLCHEGLTLGARIGSKNWQLYDHINMRDLDQRLADGAKRSANKWVACEFVFGMRGDVTDIAALWKTSAAHGANVFIDESHAAGVLGDQGMGIAAIDKTVVLMGSFANACGAYGSYIACSRKTREFLLNACPDLTNTAALPPPILGAIDASLDLIPTMEKARQELHENAEQLRVRLHRLGFDTAGSATHIIPLLLGDDRVANDVSTYLQDGGIFAPSVASSAVPDGTARLRLSLTRHHTREHCEQLLRLLSGYRI